jgi:hypothetical protein
MIERKLTNYWIIVNRKRGAIWEGVFYTEEEANKEYRKIIYKKPDEIEDWSVEKESKWVEEKINNEEKE